MVAANKRERRAAGTKITSRLHDCGTLGKAVIGGCSRGLDRHRKERVVVF
jgi:hypothetical protein